MAGQTPHLLPQQGSKGWQWNCEQDYTQRWGENSSPEVGTGSNLVYLQILVGEERSWWCFCVLAQPIEQNSLAPPHSWASSVTLWGTKAKPSQGKSAWLPKAFSTRPEKLCRAQGRGDWFPPLRSSQLQHETADKGLKNDTEPTNSSLQNLLIPLELQILITNSIHWPCTGPWHKIMFSEKAVVNSEAIKGLRVSIPHPAHCFNV